MKKTLQFLAIILSLLGTTVFLSESLLAQRQMENLDRGTLAVRTSTSQVLVTWRILGTEFANGTTYNLYRGSTLIASNLTVSNYADNTSSNSTYSVAAVINGSEQAKSAAVSVWSNFYNTISISPPSGGTTPDGVSYTYTANDCSVGDLDGDGEYEIILKWDPTNSKDNSQSGYTGNVYLDGIKMNGTRLWRINLGINIRAGAHYTQFMVYDLDGDGKAEVACKTAPGTRSGTNSYLSSGPAASDNDASDYRNSSGYILSGPEYLTIFNGQTGAELVTTNYLPARGTVSDWGDSYGNRVDRFLACIAYLDGSRPSLVMCRGYYTRSVLVAWDYRNGSLTQRWTFDTNNGYSSYAGQGNHNLSVGDIDGDGYDEIVYGAMCVDHNGAGKWNTGYGHGDAMHLSDINPNISGLEVWGIHEGTSTPGSALLSASNGATLWKTANADVGRGCSGDLTASTAGMEVWGGTSDLRSCTNSSAGSTPSSCNFVVWWDGDELREVLDGDVLDKYNVGRLVTLYNYQSATYCNGTKKTPNLQADILGDWREEVILHSSDNTKLIIFSATTTTSRRMYTLMHDKMYRLGIAWQNVAYNQPPHLSFFFGSGMSTPPTPNITLVGGGNTCTPTAITPYLQVDGGSWQQASSVTISSGSTVKFGPQPASGGSWLWSTGATTREITISNITSSSSYTVTYTNDCGAKSTQTFTVTVSGGTTGTTITIQENATGFCGVDGTVDNNNSGFTGDGFANTANASGNGVDYKVNFSSSGTYTFTFRYASTSDRPGRLIINGSTAVSSISFPSTGSWTTWTTVSANATVSAGTYDVRLEATGTSGLGNIDYMQVTGTTPSAANCNSTPVTYSLTTNISGSGTVNPSSGTYESGTVVSVTATPSSGYQFSGWSGDASGTSNPLSLTMNSNKNITATFTQTTAAATLVKHGTGSAYQTITLGESIVSFYYSWTDATTVTVSGMPSGITTAIDNSAKTVTFSGTPTQTGTFNFTVTTVGGNPNASASGTITVNASIITLTIQENETGFCSVDGTIDNNNSGYTGDGFANTTNATGNGISWTVNIPSAGSYNLVWQYANGGTTDRTAQLMVDGSTVVSSVSFPTTGSWTTWTSTSGTSVSLSAGNRVIRLQATQSGGLANIDYMSITGVSPTGVSCTGVKSATVNNESLDINDTDFKVAFYPNPVKNELNISINDNIDRTAHLQIYNNVGIMIMSKEIAGNIVTIDMSNIPSGTYIAKISTSQKVITKMFFRE
ncbi:MAG: carbohydrate-binding protein [Bacteroidales bacterium]|nr:carbohydrate-binding protein [Bacteroidales bacterium]